MVFHKKLALWGKSEAQEEKNSKDRCHCRGQCGGRLNVPAPVLIQLAGFYHTSVDYIVGLTNVREPYPRA